tara:strand:+ start:61 stop:324 length:264 start_codon:yes stop_codon:yes gene_type:complete
MSKDRAATDTELFVKKIKKFIKSGIKDKVGKETKKSKQKRMQMIKEVFAKEGKGPAGKTSGEMNKGGIVKKFKGGLMIKPKAAKRGY